MMRAFRFCAAILLCCGFLTPTVQGAEVFSFHEMLAGQRVEDPLLARGLVLAGAEVDEQTAHGIVPLHMAANAETVAALLDCGANPYALTLAGRSALHYAPDVASLELLVAAGLDVKQKDTFGESALFFAKDAPCAAWLIAKMKEAGEDPKVFLNEYSKSDKTVLHALTWMPDSAAGKNWQAVTDAWLASMPNLTAEETAAYRARLDDFTLEAMLRVLLPEGADVNARGWQGRTVAFYAGGMEARELLKEYGADFTATDDEGQAPLTFQWRLEQKSPEVVRFLIAAGADVNHITEDGDSPLACPCIRTAESLRALLEAGADPNLAARVEEWLYIPLMYHDDPECVRLLLEAGADVHVRDKRGFTALHHLLNGAELKKVEEKARLLLEAGADVNARNNRGQTPLFDAIPATGLAKILLDAGADVNARDNKGQTVLVAKKNFLKLDWLKLLLEAGVQLQSPGDKTKLLHAANDVDVLRYLIAQGLDVNARDTRGQTLLFGRDTAEEVRLLLDAGVDVNARDKKGQTCLFECEPEVIPLLLEAGADVHVVDNAGRQPLHTHTSPESALLLLAAGADVNARDDKRRTPLHEAVEYWEVELVQVLLEGGADVNATDAFGRTPIFHTRFDAPKRDLLLKYGADVNIADLNLRTPLHGNAGQWEASLRLLEAGADPNLADINGRTPLFGVNNRNVYQLFLKAGANPHHRDKDGELAECVHEFGLDGKKDFKKDENDWDADEDEKYHFDSQPLKVQDVVKAFMRVEAKKHGVIYREWEDEFF